MATSAHRAEGLRDTVSRIAPQVEKLNLVLNACREIPAWMAAIGNLNPIIAPEDLGEAGKFLPLAAGDDFVFLIDDAFVYPADYVSRMLDAFHEIAIDRKGIGVEGCIYSDFFDGSTKSQLVYTSDEKLARHEFVNQLDVGSILCRGSELPSSEFMKGASASLRFAVHCFRNTIPLICVAHDARWLKSRARKAAEAKMSPADAHEAQEVAGFGRLPFQYLDGQGRIPLRAGPAKVIEPAIRLLNPKSAIVQTGTDKPRMAVVSWSLGHNPAGRAHTLAGLAHADFNVEIIGPLIPRRGRDLWPPLRDATIPIRGYVAGDMVSYLAGARALAHATTCEIVYVSKPRFPGLLLGMLLSAKCNCPLLLDIDDLELSFVKNQSPLAFDDMIAEFSRDPAQCDNPASELWTRFSDTLIADSDAVTLSNAALQSRYDGTLVRHARDETQFVPDEARRRAMRREMGFRDDQTVILFVGTPRPHKGLSRLAAAISGQGNGKLVLCIVGAQDERAFRKELGPHDRKAVRIFPPQSYARLPDLMRSGDAVCLLQDSSSPISDFQIPAKLSEALAMGLPVLASRVAPFAEFIAANAIKPIDTDDELRHALDDIAAMGSEPERAKRRGLFLSEFSYAANRPRLGHAVEIARARHAIAPHARDAVLRQIADYLESRFGINVLNGERR